MFFNEDSEFSFYITGALLAICSVMALMFLPYNNSNRKRYAFIKGIRNISLYLIMPAFIALMLIQVYGFVTGDFITIQYSLWRLTYLVGASIGFYITRYKLLAASVDGIKYFRRGSFNSGKFQKTFGNCRSYFVLLIFTCLGIFLGQLLFVN